MENKGTKGLIWLLSILIVLVIMLISFICYRAFFLVEETNIIKTPTTTTKNTIYSNDDNKDEDDYKISNGKYLIIAYKENEYILYGSNAFYGMNNVFNQEIIHSSKTITNNKIKNAKIFNTPLTSDEDEAAFLIMDNGEVYLSYFGDKSLMLIKHPQWDEYEIKDILSCDDDYNQKCEIVLKDGTTKIVG